MTESQIQKKIIDYLESIGAYVVKIITCNRSGVADILVCLKGVFLAIEVKAPGGRVAPLQKHHQKLVNDSGGHSIIAYSVDDVREWLKSLELV